MPPSQRRTADALALLLAQYTAARQASAQALQESQRTTWWQFLATAGLLTQALAAGRAGARTLTPDLVRAGAGLTERPTLTKAATDALYDESAVTALARLWGVQSAATRAQSATQSAAFQGRALQLMGIATPGRRIALPPAPRGAPDDDVWQRPVEQARYARSAGADLDEALEALELRMADLAESDLRLGEREGARQVLTPLVQVAGYRRVLRPELSTTGVCGLCLAASDRVYSREELLPIHDRCRCVVMPIIGSLDDPRFDPGNAINQADLKRLYAAAGGTDARLLKRVRTQVYEHGELGPMLAPATARPKDADRARSDRRDDAEPPEQRAARRVTFLEQQVQLLQGSVDAGQSKYAPTLAWTQQRLTQARAAAA